MYIMKSHIKATTVMMGCHASCKLASAAAASQTAMWPLKVHMHREAKDILLHSVCDVNNAVFYGKTTPLAPLQVPDQPNVQINADPLSTMLSAQCQ